MIGGLNIPIGVAPLADGAIYYSIPSTYRWTGDVDAPERRPTRDGRSISGLVLREEGAVLVLADVQGKDVRLPLAEIDQRAVSSLSPMPRKIKGNGRDLDGMGQAQRLSLVIRPATSQRLVDPQTRTGRGR